jgi:Tfp pilus assembly protein PilN
MNAPSQLSFLPEDYLERKAQRRTNVICAVLAGIVMAAIGSAFSITEHMVQVAEEDHARIESEYAAAGKQIEQEEHLEQKQRQMSRQADLSSSLQEPILRSIILAQMTNSVPTGVTWLEFNLSSQRKNAAPPPDAKSTAPPEPISFDVNLKVSGVAPSDVQVAEFIRRLSHNGLFKDVNLVVSDEFLQDNVKVRRFQIEMALDSSADVSKLPRTKSDVDNATAQVQQN